MKKLLVGTVLSLMCVSGLNAMEGLYAGINLGVTTSMVNLKRNFMNGRNDESDMGNKNPSAGLLLGYNYRIQETPLIIGLEANLQNNGIQTTKEENTFPPFVHYITTARTNNSFGVAFRMGIAIKDLTFYGKAGISKANWQMKFQNKSQPARISESAKTTNTYGYAFGIGIDFKLNPCWSMGIDHTVNTYKEVNLSHAVGNFKMSPNFNTTSLRLLYTF